MNKSKEELELVTVVSYTNIKLFAIIKVASKL